MPERIAVQRLIVGEGKTRRVVMPGEPVTLDTETAAMLDLRDPPVVRDVGSAGPEAPGLSMNRPTTALDPLAHAAKPVGDEVDPRLARGNGNTTRDKPAEVDEL